MLSTWSFSRLSVFEQCPYRAKLAWIDRIPEPERTLPPGKKEHPLDRGNRVHEAAELYVKDNVSLLPELRAFEPEYARLREMYQQGKVSLEGEWAMDREWAPVAWRDNNAWLRLKLDAFVRVSDYTGVVIDYKTGQKFGNEVKHADQGALYQLVSFLRYPDLERIHVEFWYLDKDDIYKATYSREQGMRFMKNFMERALKMTEADEFPPKANAYTCKWCPYGKNVGNNACQYAV